MAADDDPGTVESVPVEGRDEGAEAEDVDEDVEGEGEGARRRF